MKNTLFFTFLFALNIPVLMGFDIYVKTVGFSSPYYQFYLDEDGTQLFDITSGGSDNLVLGNTYTFTRIDSGHAFYMSDQNAWRSDLSADSSIALSGDGSRTSGINSGESFTLTISNDFDPSAESLYYYCTAHASMVNGFSSVVVPEPSTYALIFGGLAALLVYCKRRNASR